MTKIQVGIKSGNPQLPTILRVTLDVRHLYFTHNYQGSICSWNYFYAAVFHPVVFLHIILGCLGMRLLFCNQIHSCFFTYHCFFTTKSTLVFHNWLSFCNQIRTCFSYMIVFLHHCFFAYEPTYVLQLYVSKYLIRKYWISILWI